MEMPIKPELDCFLEAARTLNFTQAATNLFISQQAVSKYISSLEKKLGFQLFQRSTRRVELTPEGEKMNIFFLRTAKEYEAVVESGRKSQEAKTLHFDLGIMSSTSPYLLAASIRELEKKKPGLSFSWHYSEPNRLVNLVEERQIDLAFLYSELIADRKDLRYRELTKFPPTVLVSNYLMEGKDDEEVLKELEKIPFGGHLHYKLSEEDSRLEAENLLKRIGVRCRSVRVYDSMENSLAAVEMGECFTVANELLPMYYSPHLRHIPIDSLAYLVCAWHRENPNPMLQIIVDEISGSLARRKNS